MAVASVTETAIPTTSKETGFGAIQSKSSRAWKTLNAM
jgi:hypothetical protein